LLHPAATEISSQRKSISGWNECGLKDQLVQANQLQVVLLCAKRTENVEQPQRNKAAAINIQ
jgi:hypothetical protein